jgi:hypothetical protein
MPENSSPVNPRLRCTHLHPSGHRCGSFALRGEPFCFHHHPERPLARRAAHPSGATPFGIPIPVDRRSIQIALAEVAMRVADNSLDVKRAGLLLQCLQVAAATYTD